MGSIVARVVNLVDPVDEVGLEVRQTVDDPKVWEVRVIEGDTLVVTAPEQLVEFACAILDAVRDPKLPRFP